MLKAPDQSGDPDSVRGKLDSAHDTGRCLGNLSTAKGYQEEQEDDTALTWHD